MDTPVPGGLPSKAATATQVFRFPGPFSVLLVVHGLAHAHAGIQITDISGFYGANAATLVIIEAMWIGSMVGCFAAAASVLDIYPPGLARPLVLVGSLSSLTILRFSASYWTIPGSLIDLCLLAWVFMPAGERRERSPGLDAIHPARRAHRVLWSVLLLVIAALLMSRPSRMRWGTSNAPMLWILPGDTSPDHPDYVMQNAVHVEAPSAVVEKWIRRVVSDSCMQHVYLRPGVRLSCNYAAMPDSIGTWLVVRETAHRGEAARSFFVAPFDLLILEPIDFFAHRRQLSRIRKAAEGEAARGSS